MHLQHSIYENKSNLPAFEGQFLNAIPHWCGEHSSPYCKHEQDTNEKVLSKEAAAALKEVFTDYSKEAEKYIDCFNTCQNESFNNLITVYAPKGVYWKYYDYLVCLAVLHQNEGVKFRKQLFPEILEALAHLCQYADWPAHIHEDYRIKAEDVPAKASRPKNATAVDQEYDAANNACARKCRKCTNVHRKPIHSNKKKT